MNLVESANRNVSRQVNSAPIITQTPATHTEGTHGKGFQQSFAAQQRNLTTLRFTHGLHLQPSPIFHHVHSFSMIFRSQIGIISREVKQAKIGLKRYRHNDAATLGKTPCACKEFDFRNCRYTKVINSPVASC